MQSGTTSEARPSTRARPAIHGLTIIVVLVALAITGALVFTTRLVRDRNEDRLLGQRAHEAATVAGVAILGLRWTGGVVGSAATEAELPVS